MLNVYRQLATASSGVPLFELFLKVNKKGEYQQQAAYLKWREVSSHTSPFEASNALRSTSNLYRGDSTEEKSDILMEEESDSNDREVTADFSEEIPSFQNILRDIVPGVKVKVMKVTAPGKVDRDLIAKVIEDMMDEEEEDNETDADNLRNRFTSDKEEEIHNKRSIDQVVFELTKLIGGEKIPVKVLKDVGELISLTLSQAHSHRSLSESTQFYRI
ncbi:hypothetical protein MLD38_032394 [Melastoma candidum]|uniref:Uncharacterized protein n=1 Tax=Melastoma candidum TaxID=119954 RepID=A0ACB9M445_9MYRT|nr:hypothetical protein MLD38_032394 [Melastoma candidum]